MANYNKPLKADGTTSVALSAASQGLKDTTVLCAPFWNTGITAFSAGTALDELTGTHTVDLNAGGNFTDFAWETEIDQVLGANTGGTGVGLQTKFNVPEDKVRIATSATLQALSQASYSVLLVFQHDPLATGRTLFRADTAANGDTWAFGIHLEGDGAVSTGRIGFKELTTTTLCQDGHVYAVLVTVSGGTDIDLRLMDISNGATLTTARTWDETLAPAPIGGAPEWTTFDCELAADENTLMQFAVFDTTLTTAQIAEIEADPYVLLRVGAADSDPPTVSSAATNTAGDTVTVTFNETLAGTTSAGDWTLNGTSATVASTSISGSDVTLTLTGTVLQGDTVTLDYGGSTLTDAASNPVASFTGQAVTNNSTQTGAALEWTDTFVDAAGTARTSVEIIGYFWDTSGWAPTGTPTAQSRTTDGSGNATYTQPDGFTNNPCLAQFVLGDGAGTPTGPSSPLRQVTFA